MDTNPIAPPRLIAPLDGAPVDGPLAVFRWEDVSDAAGYQVQVAADPAFVDRWFDSEIGRTDTFTLLETLPSDDTTFYWRVRQSGGEWSVAAAFRASGDQPVAQEAAVVERRSSRAAAPEVKQDAEVDDVVAPPYLAAATGPGEAAVLVAVFLLMMVLMGFLVVYLGS